MVIPLYNYFTDEDTGLSTDQINIWIFDIAHTQDGWIKAKVPLTQFRGHEGMKKD